MKANRNYGIDYLRCISMILIIISHFCVHGLSLFNGNYLYKVLIDCGTLGNIGVVIFIMISGYFFESKFRMSKFIKMLLIILFYSILCYVIIGFTIGSFSKIDFLFAFFPIHCNTYWFITVYLLIYLLNPIIYKIITLLNKKQYFYFLVISTILLTDILLTKNIFPNLLYINDFVELLIYYMIGAYIKKYNINIIDTKFKKIIVLVGIPLLIIFSIVVLNYLKISYSTILLSRNSPLVLILSIGLINIFLQIKYKNIIIKKITPHILSVYLIHDNPFFRQYVWGFIIDLFENMLFFPIILIIILFVPIIIFILCILIDYLRELIIDKFIMKNYSFLSKVDNSINNILY